MTIGLHAARYGQGPSLSYHSQTVLQRSQTAQQAYDCNNGGIRRESLGMDMPVVTYTSQKLSFWSWWSLHDVIAGPTGDKQGRPLARPTLQVSVDRDIAC